MVFRSQNRTYFCRFFPAERPMVGLGRHDALRAAVSNGGSSAGWFHSGNRGSDHARNVLHRARNRGDRSPPSRRARAGHVSRPAPRLVSSGSVSRVLSSEPSSQVNRADSGELQAARHRRETVAAAGVRIAHVEGAGRRLHLGGGRRRVEHPGAGNGGVGRADGH